MLLPTFRGHLEHQIPGQNPWRNVWSLLSEPNLLRAYALMGAMIVTFHYDNGPNRAGNPDPAQVVRWGDRSEDEMMTSWIEYVDGA